MYASLSDLVLKLPEKKVLDLCYDPEMGGTKSIDDDFVISNYEQALSDASAEVDSYILSVHTLPLSEPYPSRVVEVTCILAAYRLYARRQYSADANPFKTQYDETREWLAMLAKGTAHLDFGTEEDPDIKRRSRVVSNASSTDNPKEFDGSKF